MITTIDAISYKHFNLVFIVFCPTNILLSWTKTQKRLFPNKNCYQLTCARTFSIINYKPFEQGNNSNPQINMAIFCEVIVLFTYRDFMLQEFYHILMYHIASLSIFINYALTIYNSLKKLPRLKPLLAVWWTLIYNLDCVK